jgi:hypothetical protein
MLFAFVTNRAGALLTVILDFLLDGLILVQISICLSVTDLFFIVQPKNVIKKQTINGRLTVLSPKGLGLNIGDGSHFFRRC